LRKISYALAVRLLLGLTQASNKQAPATHPAATNWQQKQASTGKPDIHIKTFTIKQDWKISTPYLL
jgi:hypothetical protein